MQRFSSYQPSGFDWLGEIPAHWTTRRAKYVFQEIDDRSISGNEELLSVSHLTGVTPRSEKNVTMFMAEDYTGAKLCQDGDLVINTMWAWMGALGVSAFTGIVSPSYGVYRQPEPEKQLLPKYADWLFRTPHYVSEYTRRSTGVNASRLRLYPDRFLDMPVLIPSWDDQARIVTFLNQKTAEIDAAIAKKERLIKLIQEQKGILLNKALTHGLNPDGAIRDIGLECCGQVPAHWSTIRFKHCFSAIKDGLHHTPQKHAEGVNFVSTQHVRNRQIDIQSASKISLKDYRLGHPRIQPEAGDVLITLVGSIGFSAIVRDEHIPLSCTRHVGYVRPIESKINRDFLLYYTESPAFGSFINKNVSKTAQPSIYLSSIANHVMMLPPLDEQQPIVDWLDKNTGPFQRISEKATEQITQLEQMKQSLIADVVLGRIRV